MGKKSNATRFPVARIKKLIQADEDVGKLAQGVPVVVSKAIELFLASLVAECVKDADARGSTKISAYCLKRTVMNTPMFDFCSDIVEGVADPITNEDGADVEKKVTRKRKPAAAKEKKVKEDEEEDDAMDADADADADVKDEEEGADTADNPIPTKDESKDDDYDQEES